MKRVALMARKFGVDSQVVSAMFIGYFVLLVAVGITIYSHGNNTEDDTSSVTATQQESATPGNQLRN